jgi:hypothetical protein
MARTLSHPIPALGLLAAGLLPLLAAPGTASADRRIFGFTYPYMTLPAGGFELEHYLDAAWYELDDPGTPEADMVLEPDWQHQLEAEAGLTDRLDFGLYQMFRQKPFGDLRYRGTKVRSRYRFADRDELPVDLAVYMEAAYKGDELEFEQRLILAKSLGRLELAGNLKLEQELKRGEDEAEITVVPSLGAGWHVSDSLAVGLEAVGTGVREEGAWEDPSLYLGPTFSVAGRHFWWTIAVQRRTLGEDELAGWLARSLFAAMF